MNIMYDVLHQMRLIRQQLHRNNGLGSSRCTMKWCTRVTPDKKTGQQLLDMNTHVFHLSREHVVQELPLM
jgi:hypothetical protein